MKNIGSLSKASVNNVRVSPQKARLVVDLIRGKQVDVALKILRFSPKKTSKILETLLISAVSNAKEQNSVDVDRLWVYSCNVDMGKTLKRFMPRAQGRATPIKKRHSHITIELVEIQ